MEFVTGTADTLPQGLLLELARYRHRVFVQRLGWKLQTSGGIELDEFDRPDTHYVVARDAHARIIGSARLLPTMGPYLLADVFPQLLGSKDPPRAGWLWELSRFAALDLHSRRASHQHGLASPHALDLLAAAIGLAAEHGVRQLISVSPLGIERILKAAGVDCRRAGEARMVEGQALFACLIDVDEDWRAPRQLHPRASLPLKRMNGAHAARRSRQAGRSGRPGRTFGNFERPRRPRSHGCSAADAGARLAAEQPSIQKAESGRARDRRVPVVHA